MFADTVLSIRDLNIFFGPKQALFDLSVDIPDRAITAIIGPSGTGKSVFVAGMGGFLDRDPTCRISGSVHYLGHDLFARDARQREEWRREILIVPQSPSVFPASIFENIAMGVRYWAAKPKGLQIAGKAALDELVERVLVKVRLWDSVSYRLGAPASSLSTGEKQRLCLARALALRPRVLIFDEPSAHLDLITATHFEDLLEELREEHCVVIVTHSLGQAKRVSQKTAFLHFGKLVETGPSDEIFGDGAGPRDSRTMDFITGRYG